MSDDTPVLLTEIRGHVLVITLNRPHAKNSFNAAMSQALSDTLDAYDEDPHLRAAVLTGAGGSFSAGMDLKALLKGERSASKKRGGFGIMTLPPNKPLIAAIEGHAVAGGLELALCCDLIVAADNAKMGLPEVRRGLVAVGGGLFRLPRRIPYHTVMELALTGESQPASRMQALGLVTEIAPAGKVLDAAVSLGERVAKNAPLALAATKRIIREGVTWDEEGAWKTQRDIARTALKSEDAKEGPRAFAEKRAPNWQGK